MIQEQLLISELFKDIQDAISLILHCRTMWQFRADYSHIYHIGCAFNLHSIINSGLIPGGQNSSKRQMVFFLPIEPRDKIHKDPEKIDLNVPRRAQYLQNAWKKYQDAVNLGRHQSCDSERIDILSDSIECNHPSRNTSSFLYSKSCLTEDWRSLIRKSIHVTSTSTKDLTTTRLDKRNWFES